MVLVELVGGPGCGTKVKLEAKEKGAVYLITWDHGTPGLREVHGYVAEEDGREKFVITARHTGFLCFQGVGPVTGQGS